MKFRFLCFFISLTFFLLILPNAVFANEILPYDIETEEDTLFFQLKNLKPGDSVSEVVTVQNRGENDFTYNTTSKFLGGSEKFYNEILLKVQSAEGILFNGFLTDFQKLEPRFLASENQEDLKFELHFPFELGNEFQGLGFEFEIKFIVEGRPITPPQEPPSEPPSPEKPEDNKETPETPPSDEDNEITTVPSSTEENGPDPVENNENNPPIKEDTPVDIPMPKPIRPIPEDELDTPLKQGQILPSTATNIYNYLLLGTILVFSSGVLFVWDRKRRRNGN